MRQKGQHGGARPNSGRLKQSDVLTLIESMDIITAPDTVWKMLYAKVLDGDTNAIKLWLQYRFGMPTQVIEQKNININEADLTEEEIKRIKDSLLNAY